MSRLVAQSVTGLVVRHKPASSLYVSKPTDWLESRFHFSFAEYHDPTRMQFGVLRVLNDDIVQPSSGFDTHPHRDMEIFSYVLDGELTHRDSMGSAETLGRGCVQYMSAGTGVLHSEHNRSASKKLRFLQTWILPDRRGYKPAYGSRTFTREDRLNRWLYMLGPAEGSGSPLVTTDGGAPAVHLHQDANVFVAELDPGVSLAFELKPGRQLYAVCAEGSADVLPTGVVLGTRDAIEVQYSVGAAAGGAEAPMRLQWQAHADGAHVMLIEMPLA